MPLRQHRPRVNPAIVWVALVALTLATWTDSTVSTASTATAAVVIALTLIKVLLVLGSYIEIARAPYWLQGLCGLWVVGVFAVISAGYVL